MVSNDDVRVDAVSAASLCVEYWKMLAVIERTLPQLSPQEGRRIEAQLRFSKRQLEVLLHEMKLRLVDFSGEKYRSGLAVSVDNLADFDDEVDLVVSKTLEPTVMLNMTIVRFGRVLVAPEQHEGK